MILSDRLWSIANLFYAKNRNLKHTFFKVSDTVEIVCLSNRTENVPHRTHQFWPKYAKVRYGAVRYASTCKLARLGSERLGARQSRNFHSNKLIFFFKSILSSYWDNWYQKIIADLESASNSENLIRKIFRVTYSRQAFVYPLV